MVEHLSKPSGFDNLLFHIFSNHHLGYVAFIACDFFFVLEDGVKPACNIPRENHYLTVFCLPEKGCVVLSVHHTGMVLIMVYATSNPTAR